MTGNRAQIFTLEGVLAALVVVTGLIFAMQLTVATPSTAGAAADPMDSAELDSVLETAADRGEVRTSVLFWDPTFQDPDSGDDDPVNLNGFRNSTRRSQFYNGTDFNESYAPLATTLDDALDESLSMNVLVHYRNSSGQINGSFPMIFNGAPGSNAVRATTTVVVYDDEELKTNAPQFDGSGITVGQTQDEDNYEDQVFYAPDAYPESDLYNVFEVEVVVWRT